MQRSAQNVTCTFCAHSNYIAIVGRLADKLRKMLSDCADDDGSVEAFGRKVVGLPKYCQNAIRSNVTQLF